MLRITGGTLRGRRLHTTPRQNLRPTQDRVRAALFSMLGELVIDAHVADLFAGTGILGLEAYSRGAASVVWVELQRQNWRRLLENARLLCGANVSDHLENTADSACLACIRADVVDFLKTRRVNKSFDLVFADPPYPQALDFIKKILPILAQGGMLSASAVLALEQPVTLAPVMEQDWRLWRMRDYGETRLCLYRRTAMDEK